MTKEKSRYFTFLIYPESAGNNWVKEIELLGQPVAISPLHDKDLSENSEVTGSEFKKPHYHCIYIANNPVTADSVRKKLKRVLPEGAINKVQVIKYTVAEMYAYLTHDSRSAVEKKKHKYNKADITHLNNFDIDRYITHDAESMAEARTIIIKLVREFKFQNIVELYDYLELEGVDLYGLPRGDNLDAIIQSRAFILNKLFDANYQIAKRQKENERGLNEFEERIAKLESLLAQRD